MIKIANRQIFSFFFDFFKKNMSVEYGQPHQFGVIYCELLKPNETLTGDLYRRKLMRLKEAMQKERPIFHKIILQHDNATCCFGGQNILGSAEL